MEMHQVRYFLALRDELHFTRAAKHCGVAQPSLTRAIKMLEKELGGPLFLRQRGNIGLSELGQAVAPFLENLSWCAQSAKRKAADFRSLQHPSDGGADAQVGLSPRDHRDRSRELGLLARTRLVSPQPALSVIPSGPSISIEALNRAIDANLLPVQEVKDPV
jgi:hypothetical protein